MLWRPPNSGTAALPHGLSPAPYRRSGNGAAFFVKPQLPAATTAVSRCPPGTRSALRYDPEAEELIVEEAGLVYPVRNGTPVMLVEEARKPVAE